MCWRWSWHSAHLTLTVAVLYWTWFGHMWSLQHVICTDAAQCTCYCTFVCLMVEMTNGGGCFLQSKTSVVAETSITIDANNWKDTTRLQLLCVWLFLPLCHAAWMKNESVDRYTEWQSDPMVNNVISYCREEAEEHAACIISFDGHLIGMSFMSVIILLSNSEPAINTAGLTWAESLQFVCKIYELTMNLLLRLWDWLGCCGSGCRMWSIRVTL